MVRTTSENTARNSLCQFCIDSNQNDALVKCSNTVIGGKPFCARSVTSSRQLPTRCSAKLIRNSAANAIAREWSYSRLHTPPARTGQGVGPDLISTVSSVGSSGRDSAEPT